MPDRFQERRAGQQLVTPFHHVLQQLKFSWTQIDTAIATLGSTVNEI
jgi:hypothetical protein